MRRLPIYWKIMGFTISIVLFTVMIVGIVLIGVTVKVKEKELGQRSLVIARTVAELPRIKNDLTEPGKQDDINSIVEPIRVINQADYIVVMNMQHVRLSHPLDSRIRTVSTSKDEAPAFANHTYTSKAKGELGVAVRAFVPIINSHYQQIGVVLVGNVIPGLSQIISNLKSDIVLIILVTVFIGLWGAWILATHIKKQMFELEPHEIAQLLVERTETFNAMHEGVIAIDVNEAITVFNLKAKQMLSIDGDVIGQPIQEIIPEIKLHDMIYIKQPKYHRQIQLRHKNVLASLVQIKVNHQTVGAVCIFQDRTEVTRMAEELTGVKAFVSALRVQNHEHMNKLHTIGGLIQIGDQKKALDYIFDVTEKQEELTRFLSKHIHDDSISGLLLSKVSRGSELGINVKIDPQSQLHHFPKNLDRHDLVVIIGNLIENAYDSFIGIQRANKEIYIHIDHQPNELVILVEDNGAGIDHDQLERIFEQGFSTKATDGRGMGLYLVRQIVQKVNGTLTVDSEPGSGSRFVIIFNMLDKIQSKENRDL